MHHKVAAARAPCLQVSNVVLARPAKLCNFVDWKVGSWPPMLAGLAVAVVFAAGGGVLLRIAVWSLGAEPHRRCSAALLAGQLPQWLMIVACCLPLPCSGRTRRLCTSGTPPCTSLPASTRVRWAAIGVHRHGATAGSAAAGQRVWHPLLC